MPSQRPTLPPIHSLDLLPLCREVNATDESQKCSLRPIPLYQNHRSQRQASICSSTSSRTPSPPPLQHPSSAFLARIRFRLVPCPLDAADAVVVVPPPDAPYIPPLSALRTSACYALRSQALFLIGPALQQLRQPHQPLAKGARVHPYRILRSGEVDWRSPVSSDSDMSISL
ncbi:uncharacterized protein BT62DRAFT_929548 [Guyanagaster necrorhizus]|uniref:Uncharacterized protein n=1 Tax=Guyanagaster necrorhizus TaxID=856835 RepID=A0A9P7VX01_9AGAR|nr:uncharacterized protein BT62DRAFT_929548 [Guyanagaster necrorhizus MCA 3950]KAG7448457.1 hypothetical protein BT62DRAFT_929548 [Guyanagaster necrorhizus MCA 3950]